MTYRDYRASARLAAAGDVSFEALLMAAMRRADSFNAAALRGAFPDVWEDLEQRYNAPGGLLPGEHRDRVAPEARAARPPGLRRLR